MENEKYLIEERYQNSKKKIKTIAITILIVGLLIGGCLIATGVIKQNQAKKINEQRATEAYKESEKKIAKAKERLTAINADKEKLNAKIDKKQYECDSIKMETESWFATSNKCQSEVMSLRNQLNELESEEFKLEHADYKVLYNKVLPEKYIILYVIGGIIILMSGAIALSIYLITKRREILAFGAQQVMPIAQEGIEKMAPTVGNAVKEISKGITQGINEGKNNKE